MMSSSHKDFEFAPSMPIERLVRNPQQPRKTFSRPELEDLADSIAELGLMQPVVVRPAAKQDTYEIIAGERRWRASQLAGLDSLPVIIRQVDDLEAMAMAMAENLKRQNLNLIEEASGYQLLHDEYGLSHAAIARMSSGGDNEIRRDRVTRVLRLFQLPARIQEMIREGQLSFTQAELLLTDEVRRERGLAIRLATRCARDGLSVRQLRRLIRQKTRQGEVDSHPQKDADWLRLEQHYSELLGCPFRINRKGGKLQIAIDCADMDILEGVLEKLS